MTILTAILIVTGSILYTLLVHKKDLLEPERPSPVAPLEEYKERIANSLRDLQFDYRVNKLSEHDYEQAKLGLENELARVAAEIDKVLGKSAERVDQGFSPAQVKETSRQTACPRCGARFSQPLKFCGECGSPIQRSAS